MIRSFAIAAVALFAFVSPSAAQAPSVLAWDEAVAARDLALVRGSDLIEIPQMHPEKRTPPLDLGGEGPWSLRALDREPEDPEAGAVQREFSIPESVSRPLLILFGDDRHPTGIRIIVIDDNYEGFRWGSFRFINTTARNLLVRTKEQTVPVPSGWEAADLRLEGEARGFGAAVTLPEDRDKPIYSAVWQHDPDVRTLCFLVESNDPRLGPVALKAVPEHRRTLELEANAEDE